MHNVNVQIINSRRKAQRERLFLHKASRVMAGNDPACQSAVMPSELVTARSATTCECVLWSPWEQHRKPPPQARPAPRQVSITDSGIAVLRGWTIVNARL